MLTPEELARAILVPLLVAVVIAALGTWRRRWAWALPVAAGAGFLAGFALFGVPRLPPRDGTDWLFWLAFPLAALGAADTLLQRYPRWRRFGWLAGAAAGAAVFVIGRPLVPGGLSASTLATDALAYAAAGAALVYTAHWVEPRVGSWAVVAAFCITVGGAGVVVMSSHLRIVGIYGLAASAALGPVAAFAVRFRGGEPNRPGRGVAVLAAGLLAGLLAGGRYYPDPGVSTAHLFVLTAAPVLVSLGALLPIKRPWVRGAVAVLAVAVAVGAVAVPTALEAKRAAEATPDDPYGAYYQ